MRRPDELAEALAWAGDAVGSAVVVDQRLAGGMTSWMTRLEHADGATSVLRLVTEEPWRRHGPDLVAREARTQQQLAGTPVPAPSSVATGVVGGVAAHLMTLLPGRPGDGPVTALARLLADIHEVVADPAPRTFQSWAWEAKRIVPDWSSRPEAWRRAFDVLAAGEPTWEPCFLQRDFGPRNVLWQGERVSGVVDWVETSTGPAWLDVAHGASNLALRHGPAEAARLAAAYVAETGRRREPWWELLDVVGFLPPPGGALWDLGAPGWEALEDLLVDALDHLS
ncbi:hypothetical protein GCM10009623_23790 [Nocardioides aestuarii]|uniref:Phosphotransferase family protein n=1 Tax=Nocardioides aestuarii TaxID=252231 RepID=A0ABW4TNG7_9ACTN